MSDHTGNVNFHTGGDFRTGRDSQTVYIHEREKIINKSRC